MEKNLRTHIAETILKYEKELLSIDVLLERERTLPIKQRRNFPAIINLTLHKKAYLNTLTELNHIRAIIECESTIL